MVLDGEIHGKSGHAARGEGINAIYKAIDIVNRLRNLTFPAVSRRLGPIRINVTQIEAGTQHNVVPDLCKNSRRRAHDRCLYERTNLATHSRCRPRMLAHSSKRAIAPIIDSGNPSARCAPHVCRKNAVWLAHSERPSVNAVPFPEIRPGDSARSHTADEYIRLDEIREAIQIYYTILDGLIFPKESR